MLQAATNFSTFRSNYNRLNRFSLTFKSLIINFHLQLSAIYGKLFYRINLSQMKSKYGCLNNKVNNSLYVAVPYQKPTASELTLFGQSIICAIRKHCIGITKGAF